MNVSYKKATPDRLFRVCLVYNRQCSNYIKILPYKYYTKNRTPADHLSNESTWKYTLKKLSRGLSRLHCLQLRMISLETKQKTVTTGCLSISNHLKKRNEFKILFPCLHDWFFQWSNSDIKQIKLHQKMRPGHFLTNYF